MLLLLLIGLGAASVLQPPVLPLTVRTPYLSTWLKARDPPWQSWPMFYTGESLGFSILAKAGGNVYPLLGRPHDSLEQVKFPHYQGAQFDASTTNLSYRLDGSSIVVSFLSPITPTSTLRQALPASYVEISVDSTFDIAFYIDLNGQWVSGDKGATVEWELLGPLKTWKIQRKHQLFLTEINDRAEWGTLWFTGSTDLDHASGTSGMLRRHFARHGKLSNETDQRFRAIMDDEPVIAFAKTVCANSSSSLLFSLAHTQQHIVSYAMPKGNVLVEPLWKSHFGTEQDMLDFHFHDHRIAKALATNYSEQVHHDALTYAGQNYSDIVDLSARQVMGATTFGQGSKLFLKEISSNGNAQTVDIIFPLAPFLLYTSPRWLEALLEPLLEHQLAGLYPNNYSMHDLGTHFPNLTGHADGKDERMPVEESADMLVISLALVHAMQYRSPEESQSPWSPMDNAGLQGLDDAYGGSDKDKAKAWTKRSWKLWQRWADYLVEHTLWPENQLCTDDFAGELALQSNLALKGILAIRAMSELAKIVDEDHKYYHNISDVYVAKWQEYAINGKRAKLAYNWQGSWTTLYSLYSDALLCFHPFHEITYTAAGPGQKLLQDPYEENFLPHGLYKQQSDWYAGAMQRYGLPLDNRHLYSKSDWQLYAASVAMPETRKLIIDGIALWVNETTTDRPFSDLFNTEPPGGFPGPNFFARPVVGGHFAPLALQRACKGHAADAFV